MPQAGGVSQVVATPCRGKPSTAMPSPSHVAIAQDDSPEASQVNDCDISHDGTPSGVSQADIVCVDDEDANGDPDFEDIVLETQKGRYLFFCKCEECLSVRAALCATLGLPDSDSEEDSDSDVEFLDPPQQCQLQWPDSQLPEGQTFGSSTGLPSIAAQACSFISAREGCVTAFVWCAVATLFFV